jgi:hypothetical protein
MTRIRHTPEQGNNRPYEVNATLSLGHSMTQLLQHLGMSVQTFRHERGDYGGMKFEKARRLEEFEVKNAWLKRLVAGGSSTSRF